MSSIETGISSELSPYIPKHYITQARYLFQLAFGSSPESFFRDYEYTKTLVIETLSLLNQPHLRDNVLIGIVGDCLPLSTNSHLTSDPHRLGFQTPRGVLMMINHNGDQFSVPPIHYPFGIANGVARTIEVLESECARVSNRGNENPPTSALGEIMLLARQVRIYGSSKRIAQPTFDLGQNIFPKPQYTPTQGIYILERFHGSDEIVSMISHPKREDGYFTIPGVASIEIQGDRGVLQLHNSVSKNFPPTLFSITQDPSLNLKLNMRRMDEGEKNFACVEHTSLVIPYGYGEVIVILPSRFNPQTLPLSDST